MEEMDNSSQMNEMKKKRRLPAIHGEDAEVIALSPETLRATRKFVCHVCGKGFQRDQNLQLHRRCHSLPWELKQRSAADKEAASKRVFVCPVATCAHHDPSKALGDLSGIKKHFRRKHSEKTLRCGGCAKRYAVHSDLKAHLKTCGTKTYRCDCGTLCYKKENFERHKAYCEELSQALARHQQETESANRNSSLPPPPPQPSGVLSPVLSGQNSEILLPGSSHSHWKSETPPASAVAAATIIKPKDRDSPSSSSGNNFNRSTNEAFSVVYAPPPPPPFSFFSHHYLPGNAPSSSQYVAASPPPALSATSLLQKASQIGSTYSGGSFLHGLGLATPPENKPVIPSGGLPDSMMEPSPATVSGDRLPTLDFLGVGGGYGLGLGEYFWDNPDT